MAPALTEPLSPAEKLSKSTATVTTTPTTRSSKRQETAAAAAAAAAVAVTPISTATDAINTTASTSITSNNCENTNIAASCGTQKEKRNRNSNLTTTSTRVTRSKDAYQRVFEQAVSNTAAVDTVATVDTSTTTTTVTTASTPTAESKPKSDSKQNNNEQMGVSPAPTSNNNNNNSNNNNINKDCSKLSASSPTNLLNNNSKENNAKDNSTAQLLADLTNDFEEAITAEICLRKQLLDVSLSKEAVSSSAVGSGCAAATAVENSKTPIPVTSATQNNLVNKITTTTISVAVASQLHMESKPPSSTTATATVTTVDSAQSSNVLKPQNATEKAAEAEQTIEHEKVQEKNKVVFNTAAATLESQKTQRHHETTRPQIISVEELPPISTDSTMTASEVEDNLEERLSQLDGTAIISPSCDDIAAAVAVDDAMGAVSATPPGTPTQQQTLQYVQQQLQQTPPTPIGQQLQQQSLNAFTPHSTTSSVNTLSSTNLPHTGEQLEDHDIEEVLKVLKNFDGNTSSDALCDLNVLFNEVYYTTLNYDEISSQPATSSISKPNPLKEMQAEIEKKQQSMQRKIDFLVRRMRKVQARYMCKHTSEEISGLFEWSARTASSKGNGVHNHATDAVTAFAASVISARPPALNWAEEKKNTVPAAQMSSMLRKLETVANAQQLCTTPTTSATSLSSAYTNAQLKRSKKTAAAQDAAQQSSSANTAITSERKGDAAIVVVPTFDMNVAEEITHVAGLLQSEMREIQNAIDSDATESSSGGESADEMVSYNNQIQQPLSIAKRAAWRYSRDRAAIASRWSWLLSQIADLEIKIRQHSELFQEIIRTKGPVTSSFDSAAMAVANTTTGVTPQTTSVNGYKDISVTTATLAAGAGGIKNNFDDDVGAEVLDGSCRTRGFVPTVFRKRKLLQTTNIHTFSKKAARQSTIKCGCQWPLHPCALCTGRTDPTAPRDLPDTMMMADRVALLDSGYHPVLSFREDVSNSIHLEAIARLPEWQQRVMRCQVKSIAKSIWKAEREAAAAAGHVSAKKYGNAEPGTKRRYIKKKDRIIAEEKAAAAAANGGSAAGAILSDSAAATGMGGNGIGALSTSTTPLVANKLTKNSKKLHCHLVGDGVLLEPLSPATTNFNNGNSNSSSNHNPQQNINSYIHQTSDYPPQNYDQFNLNQAHSSLISNHNSSKNSKNRKLSSTSATNVYYQHHYNNQHNNHHYTNNNQYYNTNGTGSGGVGCNEMNFLHTNDNWDCFATRSRTSSPTHGGSSNYHKYERSLDRKNRSSYDIDNIVIPYSVAAATRVEILPYKEIPTPKWRIIDGETSERGSSVATNAKAEATANETNLSNGFENEVENTANNSTTLSTETSVIATTTTTAPIKETKQSTTIITHTEESENTNGEDVKTNNNKDVNTDTSSIVEEKKNSNVLNEVNIITNNKVIKEQKMVELSEEPMAKKSKLRNDTVHDSAVSTNAFESDTTTAAGITVASSDDEAKRLENECDSSEDIDEDISDETMMLRHERALTEERRKFQTYLKFPWSTRSRANRRIDSRAESSGANTPDPTSPAPNTPSLGGGDLESIPSPLAPSTPLNPLDSISETSENPSASLSSAAGVAINYINSKRYERRRTTSTKKDRELERRSSTPDPKELIPPYEPLKFPLTDDMFEILLRTMPSDYHQNDSKYLEDCHNNASVKITRNSNNRYTFKNDTFVATTASTIVKRASITANKSVASCDVMLMHNNNNRKSQQLQHQQKVNSNSMRKAANIVVAGANREGDVERVGEGFKDNPAMVDDMAQKQNNVNGQIIANGNSIDDNEGNGDDDDEIDEEMVEELDDDYPRHHLAPPKDDDDIAYNINHVTKERSFDEDDEYGAYVGRRGRRGMLGDSEGDSSDTEPFQDDDPNDPEWKGETAERIERTRKKF